MTHVSKHKLPSKTEKKLFTQFTNLFAKTDQNVAALLFSDLFTSTEKIMFMKRMGIILLLHQEQSTYRIAKLLQVSDSTVRIISKQYQAGKFDHIISLTHKKDFNREQFWKTLEKVLRLGMPAYGKDRWQGFGF